MSKYVFVFLTVIVGVFGLLVEKTLFASPETVIETQDESQAKSEDDDTEIDSQVEAASSLAEVSEVEKSQKKILWQAPNFSNQDGLLGWRSDVFVTPPGLKRRVQFWKDVYSKYTSQQAVFHDSKYIDIIYSVQDFTELYKNPNLTLGEKARQEKAQLKAEKKRILAVLKSLEKPNLDVDSLSAEENEIFEKFRFVTEKNKFSEASRRGRLRFQVGLKDRFKMGVYFSGRYIREMEKIFREEGLPIELTRLPFVESSFNLYAYSKKRASGIWQFMPYTGRLYLKMNTVVDQRNDPLMATRAAARLLKFNYNLLNSWPLAVTAYNHGPAGMARIVKELGSTDLNEMIWNSKKRRFGFASENFYSEFLAALDVESNSSTHFGKLEVSPPLEYDTIVLDRPVTFKHLAESMRFSLNSEEAIDRARLFNPFFTKPIIAGYFPIPKNQEIRVPKGYNEQALTYLSGLPQTNVKVAEVGTYKVYPGDTVWSISRDFGVSIRSLLEANGLEGRSLLRPGQQLIIPK